MRAVVLLCLLHGALVESMSFNWDGAGTTIPQAQPYVCLTDQASCGCCVMQRTMERMETFFNMTVAEISKNLTNSKMALNNMRASRSAFSVALYSSREYDCFGPFAEDVLIRYRHIFLNLGDGYSALTGIFTAPRSGVYSLAVTVYSAGSSARSEGPCANLQVNGLVVTSLQEDPSQDREDSATAVVSVKLKAGDAVAVSLPKGCLVCDGKSHFNTFTGFLLYPC